MNGGGTCAWRTTAATGRATPGSGREERRFERMEAVEMMVVVGCLLPLFIEIARGRSWNFGLFAGFAVWLIHYFFPWIALLLWALAMVCALKPDQPTPTSESELEPLTQSVSSSGHRWLGIIQ
jgi:hypothetical protein